MKLGGVAAAVLALVAAGRAAAADVPGKCVMYQLGELKVEFRRNRPLLQGAVNGQPVVVLLDTGADRSILHRAKALALHLPLEDIPGMRMGGAGGVTQAQSAYLHELQIAGLKRSNFNMLVVGEGIAADFDILLGEDFLGRLDIEFDLAHGLVRLLQPKNCADQDMPYWAKGAYNEAPIVSGHNDRIGVETKINGHPIRAILDSGAQTSVATPRAAAMAGVKLEAAEGKGRGIGGLALTNQIGVLDSFSVGDETIRNTRLRFSDLFGATTFSGTGSLIAKHDVDEPEMLLGADFLRSHRVLVSRARRMIYFTYEGGPVFDYTRRPPPSPVTATASDGPASSVSGSATPSSAPSPSAPSPAATPG